MTFGSTLGIVELSAPRPGAQPRSLVLQGSALPFMGAVWGFENKIETTWYPGNADEATQQNLGPKELPSDWEGFWQRTLLGKTPATLNDDDGATRFIVDPMELREVIEDIGRRGARVRVIWEVTGQMVPGSARSGRALPVDVKIVREGLVKSFKTNIDRHTDVRWNISFEWSGRGVPMARVATANTEVNLQQIASSMEASVNATVAKVNATSRTIKKSIRKSAVRTTLGQFESLAMSPQRAVEGFTRGLQQNVSQFKRVGEVAAKVRNQPFAIANNVINFAQNTVSTSNNFIDAMGRESAEQKSLKTSVDALLKASVYFGRITDEAILAARRAREMSAKVQQAVVSGGNRGAISVRESATTRAGTIIAIHVAKQGDTPQKVSMKFYKSADRGEQILIANRLPTYTPEFRRGQILVIPALTNLARAV